MSTFHIHYTFQENSGEIRRIKNINADLAQHLTEKIVEIAFISIVDFKNCKKNRFRLSDKVVKKYYLPLLPLSSSKWFLKKVNSIWCSLLVFILWLFHRPHFAIAEFSIGGQVMRFLPSSVKCIIDVHGATREEYEYSTANPQKKVADTYDYLERKSMQKASFIVCQSEAMKKYLLEKYAFLEEERIFSYKCGADNRLFHIDPEERKATRKELGINDTETLFIYSGGLHKWQRIEDSVNLFVEYTKKGNGKFLILTLDKSGAEAIVNKTEPGCRDRFIIRSVPNKEVYKYLNAADIAFLLRDDVILNRVASPTKLAEYMFCGLPIISTSVSTHWIENPDFIFNIDKEGNIEKIDNFIKKNNREAIAKYAQEYLSLERDRKNLKILIDKAK